jgi:uncharacterized protein YeaO (DUF488 family)
MVKIYTSNIDYNGSDRLDITVKSGDLDFAPTWDMVMGHKNRKLSDEKYISMYTELMNISFEKHRKKWDWLLSQDRITLLCYCKKGKFCHRKVLAEILHLNFKDACFIGELDSKGNLIQLYQGEEK